MVSKNKKIFLGLCFLIVGGLTIRFLFFNNKFLYAGTLEVTKIDLAARLAAAIAEVGVHEGDRVTQGQILARLACEDFKIDADLAEEEYNRNKKLFEKKYISQHDFDQYKNRMEDTKIKVDWCAIISPIDGTILSRYHEPGEWMIPGTNILTLANIHDIWAYIYVPQPLIAKLSVGMKLKGVLPELKNRVFEGKIIKISDEAEFTPKNVQTRNERERLVYGVKVSFMEANGDEVLKPGMTIEVMLPK